MSKFIEIDAKLESLSAKLNARLTKERPSYSETSPPFQERRIDWIDNEIFKAIIIQPTFEYNGINSKIWNFINLAWHYDAKSNLKIQWTNHLVSKDDFDIIISNIDDLLLESERTLLRITKRDLK